MDRIVGLLEHVVRLLTRHTSAFIILTAITAFFIPDVFAWVQQGQRASVILGFIMLTMGVTLSADDYRCFHG